MSFNNKLTRYSGFTCSLLVSSMFLTGCNNDSKENTNITPVIPPKPLEVNLVHINDSHSHLDEESTILMLETSMGKREEIQVSNGGFARVAALMNTLASTEKNPIKIHSGDAITGDLYFTLKEGEAEADLMNSVCFDTLTLGNHEFDNTDDGLKKFIGFLNDKGNCENKTQVLSANVEFGKTSALYQTNLVKPYTVMEKEGQKIALIGLTIANKTKNASRPNQDTVFNDEVVTAQKYIDELKQQGINKIIVQSHLGYGLEKDLATKLSGVDVIVGGDSHTLLADAKLKSYGISPEGDYPTVLKNKDGDQVCVVQAWQYSYVVGQLKVNFDADGKIEACAGKANVLIGDDFKRTAKDAPALMSTELDSIKRDIENSNSLRIVQPDAIALSILEPYKVAKNLLGKEKVAIANDNLCLRRVPGMTKDTSRSSLGDVCNKADFINQHGGDVQQLVAEAFLQQGKKYFNADISIQNGGGVRVDLPQGDITVEKIYTVLPFKNTLVQLNATGQEIKAVLEDAMDAVTRNNTGSYPYAGGLQWDVDLTQAKGQRVSNLKVRNTQGQYEPLNLNQTYQVITINFLADGQDFYSSFKNITGERRVDVGLDYAEAFLKYVEGLPGEKGQKVLSRLPVEHYSTQNYKE
ncbi:MAG TPA: 5'-nucleotidase C-terminal domain-containing protein [Candidatus Avacidaminococcus intestinavium]|uniref:5'-nucleotidase C-terminal domain-containing protein n=1 Tax=Candidatus Avacidaminococcus intestinavium TaxID=2840684 RepID=A0A9D1MQE4_9FIRM|nr:5'-nucleotidase C-terminal domain-containing protein [Candidatus Avacidaminococcus intestinavium]